MNNINFNQQGGLPLTTNMLNALQKAYTIFNSLGAIVGDFTIISGCITTGTNVSDGVVFMNGEVLEFKGGPIQTKVVIRQNITALLFQNGNTNPTIFERYLTFGTGLEEIDWNIFKRGFPTKNIEDSLNNKMEVSAMQALIDRIATLEKKTAIFQNGGGMFLWNKPANQIPAGFAEVVNWRGRIPVGLDSDQPEYNPLGKTGGVKTITLPTVGYGVGENTTGGIAGTLMVASGQTENGEFLESVKKASTPPAAISILNPYRVVMFIEYTA